MDKSKTILNIARERLGNQPTYNPVDFLEMCAKVRDELEAAEHTLAGGQGVCVCENVGLEYLKNDVWRCGNCKLPLAAKA